MDKVVLDANVFLKLFKQEHDSDEAESLFRRLASSMTQIVEPSAVVNETVHACERGGLDVDAACRLFKGLIELNLSFSPLTGALIDKTLAITQEGHSKSGFPTFSDSMYHAIAIQENALFITADRRHYEKTKHLGNIQLLKNLNS